MDESDSDPGEPLVQKFSYASDIAYKFASNAMKTVVFQGEFKHTMKFTDLAMSTEKLSKLLDEYDQENEEPDKELVDTFGIVWEQILSAISMIATVPHAQLQDYNQDVGTFGVLVMTFIAASLRVTSTRSYLKRQHILFKKKIVSAYVPFNYCLLSTL